MSDNTNDMSDNTLVLGPLDAGITRSDEAFGEHVWNVLGHTYITKIETESTYSWLSIDPAGTGVPPHVHPTQDEFIYVLEGRYTLYLDGDWFTATAGDTVRMPRNIAHAYFNREEEPAKSVFWVSPGGKLANLFRLLHDVEDPDEVVRLSALNDVDFLPPGSVPGI